MDSPGIIPGSGGGAVAVAVSAGRRSRADESHRAAGVQGQGICHRRDGIDDKMWESA